MKKEYTIKEFLNKEFLQYSNYKVVQELPNFMDGLSQTARKEIWVLLKMPDKKIKTTDIYSLIYNELKYLHGDKSAFNVFESLAADYKNNLNLIEAKANFGYRTNQQAAAARYASAKISKLARLIFPKEDYPIMEKQYLEGSEIEPPTLYPIIPLAIVNGFRGIAVGFSSSILPRDPQQIINQLLLLLSGKSKQLKDINIKFPYFKGNIYKEEKSYVIEGKIIKSKTTKKTGIIEIIEVPYGYDREKVISILDKLEEQNKIINFEENCIKNQFYFKIKVPLDIYNKSEEELLTLFKLKSKETENLTFLYTFEKEKTIKEYDNVLYYLKDWILTRLKIYDKRKEYLLNQLKEKIDVIQNKIKFIKLINDQKLIINKQSKTSIIKQCEKFKLEKVNDNYDYLLSMPLYTLTQEKIDELTEQYQNLLKEFEILSKKDNKTLWIEDLEKLKTEVENIKK